MAGSAGSEERLPQSSSLNEDELTLKFIELQYNSLRQEIETSRERHFKLATGALVIFPAFQVLAGFIERNIKAGGAGVPALFLLAPLPLVILTLYIWYYAEHETIARCALYLRENIEPMIPGLTGWET